MSAALKLDKKYTYADLQNWPEDERWELIDSVPNEMAATSTKHKRISRNLNWALHDYLKDKECEVFAAPFDVRLNADEADDTIVQPDLVIICDPNKIDDKGCQGPPDLVIEILSPSNFGRDTKIKLQKYCEANVREILFIHPDDKDVQTFVLTDGNYSINLYNADDIVPISILPGFGIDLKDIF